MYIKPVLTYCGEVLITATKRSKKLIERIENQALRLITGAVKTTPINALHTVTKNKPIILNLETQALLAF